MDIFYFFLRVSVKLPPDCSLRSAAKLSIKKRRTLEEERFEAFPDPADNWMVWDNYEDDVAEVGTQRLRTLTQGTARAFSILLNKLFSQLGGLGASN